MKTVMKSIMGVSAAAVMLAGTLAPTFVYAWGDSANGRPTYTLAQINNNELGDKIVFNSITDNPKVGDERNFVGALKSSDVKTTDNTWKADSIEVQDGETYTIRLYVHNNNNKGTQAIAEGVKAYFSLPTTVSKDQTLVGYLDSTNATVDRIWDEVHLTSNDFFFYVEYVKDSAKYINHTHSKTFNLPNEIVVGAKNKTGGALLGYDTMDGRIPGCFEYDGEVQIQVKVHKFAAASVKKQVRIKGTKGWNETVEAKVGDEVEYQIEYVNLLKDQVKDVMIRDFLPANVEYVPGSTVLYNSNHQTGLAMLDTIATTGINIGAYDSEGNALVRFVGKVVDKDLGCGNNKVVNWANVTVDKTVVGKDDATVTVGKTCEPTKPDEPTKPNEPVQPDEPKDEPKELPDTGAGTIVTGVIGAGSMVTTLGYYIASRKKLM